MQDNFYIVDLGALQRLYRAWGEAMPRVHPYYAVSRSGWLGEHMLWLG